MPTPSTALEAFLECHAPADWRAAVDLQVETHRVFGRLAPKAASTLIGAP